MRALAHDAIDASRMAAAAVVMWNISQTDVQEWLKTGGLAATLVYMTGKACAVWYHLWKEKNNEKVLDNSDD